MATCDEIIWVALLSKNFGVVVGLQFVEQIATVRRVVLKKKGDARPLPIGFSAPGPCASRKFDEGRAPPLKSPLKHSFPPSSYPRLVVYSIVFNLLRTAVN